MSKSELLEQYLNDTVKQIENMQKKGYLVFTINYLIISKVKVTKHWYNKHTIISFDFGDGAEKQPTATTLTEWKQIINDLRFVKKSNFEKLNKIKELK